MKASLVPCVQSTRRIDIDKPRTIDFMGEAARVYATPTLVRDIEAAARELLRSHLDHGEDSIATRVELDHLAASLLGMTVEITVRVVDVNGRAVTFEFEGRDDVEPICRGRQHRLVVDVAKTEQRLAAKAAKVAKR
jgi:predicted thioesterase